MVLDDYTYHSGQKYKDRLVSILMYKRPLYFRPEFYSDNEAVHSTGRAYVL